MGREASPQMWLFFISQISNLFLFAVIYVGVEPLQGFAHQLFIILLSIIYHSFHTDDMVYRDFPSCAAGNQVILALGIPTNLSDVFTG